ncbi:extended synaptotagmin-2 isoform X1 [Callorhinchus milii]|uniref:extended synaptotagmin-2 isoform X1 n=1 Tax=Callorhinchus milii TaxID=7868 RepID=UPI000457412E|nr:extended synaptotagmin-2 isoform X1 [Callorhinchus milii]|eukprot:gi/632966348/ref/XP_007899368.1/ PREDICTED: extended synaptotagmin-2 isoform X1 [Callorhinchus milii]
MSVQGPTAAAPTVTEEPGASAAAAAAARKRQASVVDEGAIPKPQQHSKQQQQPPQQLISVDVAGILLQFAKTFVIIFPVYALGYLGLSFSWVLVGLFFFFWWQRNRGNKRSRLSRALAFLEHEDTFREEIKSSDLPSWVHFPDVERVEWINKTVKHMWPYICQFVEKLLKETIEPAVRGANSHLSTFSFTKINLGDKPLRINGVKTYTENVDNRQIILDLQISYVGNSEIDLEIKRYFCRAGVKSIQLNGIIRVILEPLLGDMPLIGALSFFFLRRPLLEINWTGLTNLLDIPGLNGMSNTIILDIISNYLVLPNRITVPLVDEVQLAQLRFPIPKGFLRIHFIEAQDLEWKDTFMKGLVKGKSDPYGILRVGNQMFQSKTIKENLNPRWNEVYEALVYESPGQELEIELFDEDPDKDDFLGSLILDLVEVQKEQLVDQWFDLEEVSRGKLHLKLEWLSLLPTPEKLTEAMASTKAIKGQANDGLSSALLIVYMDSAKNLPNVYEGNFGCGYLRERRASGLVFCENTSSVFRDLFFGKKMNSEPNPFVQLSVGHNTFESKIRYRTTEPVWEEAFTFFVHNPQTQELDVEIKDDHHQCSLGSYNLRLEQLLEAEDLTLNQRFQLKHSGPNSTLKMKIVLRILCIEKQERSPDRQSSTQLKKYSKDIRKPTPKAQSGAAAAESSKGTPGPLNPESIKKLEKTDKLEKESASSPSPQRPTSLQRTPSGHTSSSQTGSPSHLSNKEPTPSIASDISLPFATQELRQRLRQLQNGTTLGQSPLGQIQLTIRHSSQRNKLIVVVHGCRNLIAFSEDGSDPYARLYLLPDKRRSGRRKTSVLKKQLNPVYDETFEFSVSQAEVQKRTLDVAVKNSGGFLSRDKGLLGKLLIEMTEEVARGSTQWYDLTEDGTRHQPQT